MKKTALMGGEDYKKEVKTNGAAQEDNSRSAG